MIDDQTTGAVEEPAEEPVKDTPSEGVEDGQG